MSYYYEILPLVKTGQESRTFTYTSKEPLNLGSLVQVPLRNRSTRGLVISKTVKPKYQTREISKVLSTESILSEEQLKIAKMISEYYFCSLGETINTFLPFDFGKKRRLLDTTQQMNHLTDKPTIKPNLEQSEIITKIKGAMPGSIHLIHGVTGSGKTEIYLRLAESALREGRGSIILVPEIALTPQTKARFEERFGDQVAVWHSNLKETEKYNTWLKIKNGQKQIVLGARSAIFTPCKKLAYIFIDEEHESSYKQDQNPRYDARPVSAWLAQITGAKLILGSATPRIESYYHATNYKLTSSKSTSNGYSLYSMNKRIVQESMPPVQIVDLRDEFRKGNKSIISDSLAEAIQKTLTAKKQIMLLVNRRGAATFVTCRDCGYIEACPHCELPLTYHPSEGQILKCHHCNYHRSTPVICPTCGSAAIKYFGLGTQRTELELQKLFPKAKIARMDRDTTKSRGSHEAIYENFKDEKFDILIGTQMIAKGWDLPNVELVGVISADTMLNFPDFRSSERTFSLLTQVAGRTGRGYHPGRVIIQTYNPDNPAVLAASQHNYKKLFDLEITAREKYSYPPFSTLIKLTYSHQEQQKAEAESQRMANELLNLDDVKIMGPAPAFLEKLAGKYRYQIVIKLPIINPVDTNSTCLPTRQESQAINRREATPTIENRKSKIETLNVIKENIKTGWQVDIDPESLL